MGQRAPAYVTFSLMTEITIRPLRERIAERLHDWCLEARHTLETESSVIVFGRRGRQLVVLKVARQVCDEWHSGAVLNAFQGNGMARVYDYLGGAVLLERLRPGTLLANLSLNNRD